MLTSLIITFREVLEAALVVVIVLAYLKRVEQARFNRNVWIGVGTGVILSISLAITFNLFLGGFTGRAEKVFEGVMMLLAVILLTWMIMWMMVQRHIVEELEAKVHREITERHAIGISILVSIAVLREGVETVIFLQAASYVGGTNLLGAVVGGMLALILGYLFFIGAKKIRIKRFFQVTSVILILFAAGLTSHAIAEFQEAGLMSPIVEPLYDITWLIGPDTLMGSILHSLFGYTGKPSLSEMIGYAAYLVLAYILYRNIERIHRYI